MLIARTLPSKFLDVALRGSHPKELTSQYPMETRLLLFSRVLQHRNSESETILRAEETSSRLGSPGHNLQVINNEALQFEAVRILNYIVSREIGMKFGSPFTHED